MCINNGGIITKATHGYNPRGVHDTDLWGGRWRRGGGEICGVITIHSDIGGMISVGVTGKGVQHGQAPKTLHEKAL